MRHRKSMLSTAIAMCLGVAVQAHAQEAPAQATDEAGSKGADETAQDAVEPDVVEPESPEEPPTQGGEEEDAS